MFLPRYMAWFFGASFEGGVKIKESVPPVDVYETFCKKLSQAARFESRAFFLPVVHFSAKDLSGSVILLYFQIEADLGHLYPPTFEMRAHSAWLIGRNLFPAGF